MFQEILFRFGNAFSVFFEHVNDIVFTCVLGCTDRLGYRLIKCFEYTTKCYANDKNYIHSHRVLKLQFN